MDAPARVPEAPALRRPRFLMMKLEPMKMDEEMASSSPSCWSSMVAAAGADAGGAPSRARAAREEELQLEEGQRLKKTRDECVCVLLVRVFEERWWLGRSSKAGRVC
jgi:hypothetical protein